MTQINKFTHFLKKKKIGIFQDGYILVPSGG